MSASAQTRVDPAAAAPPTAKPDPRNVATSGLRRAMVAAAFFGTIGYVWYQGHRQPEVATEALESGMSFRQVAAESGIDFRHHAPVVDTMVGGSDKNFFQKAGRTDSCCEYRGRF